MAVPLSVAIGSLTAPAGSANAASSTAGATPRSGIGASRAMSSVVFTSTPAVLAALSKSAALFSFAAIAAAFCRLSSRAFCSVTSSRTRSFTSSSFGHVRHPASPVTVIERRSRATSGAAPLTSPSFSSNAAR